MPPKYEDLVSAVQYQREEYDNFAVQINELESKLAEIEQEEQELREAMLVP